MATVKVYTTAYCPYCVRAKQLLTRKGVAYEEIDVADNDTLRNDLVERSGGRRTVPQIFIDDASIGGYDELRALDDDGRLNAMLGLA